MTPTATAAAAQDALAALARGEAPVLETLTQMNWDTLARSGLDARTYHLVRLAALVAMDAAPISYAMNLEVAADAGVDLEAAQGVFTAIAPIVGSARVVAAAGHVLQGFELREILSDDAG